MKTFFVFLADFYDLFFSSSKSLEDNNTPISPIREYQKKHYKFEERKNNKNNKLLR